jgi:hypothetical protein
MIRKGHLSSVRDYLIRLAGIAITFTLLLMRVG